MWDNPFEIGDIVKAKYIVRGIDYLDERCIVVYIGYSDTMLLEVVRGPRKGARILGELWEYEKVKF